MSSLIFSESFLILPNIDKKGNLLWNLHEFGDHSRVHIIDLVAALVQLVNYEFQHIF